MVENILNGLIASSIEPLIAKSIVDAGIPNTKKKAIPFPTKGSTKTDPNITIKTGRTKMISCLMTNSLLITE